MSGRYVFRQRDDGSWRVVDLLDRGGVPSFARRSSAGCPHGPPPHPRVAAAGEVLRDALVPLVWAALFMAFRFWDAATPVAASDTWRERLWWELYDRATGR